MPTKEEKIKELEKVQDAFQKQIDQLMKVWATTPSNAQMHSEAGVLINQIEISKLHAEIRRLKLLNIQQLAKQREEILERMKEFDSVQAPTETISNIDEETGLCTYFKAGGFKTYISLEEIEEFLEPKGGEDESN